MVKTHNELKRITYLAEQKARECNHLFVNSGHILLVVVEKAEQKKYRGAFKKLFKRSFREQIRQKFKKATLSWQPNSVFIPELKEKSQEIYTQELMETICYARTEALGIDLGIDIDYLDYLLLGMIRHKTSIGGEIWRCIGPTLEKAREMVRNHRLQKTGKRLRKKAKDLCRRDNHKHKKHKSVSIGGKGCKTWRI